MTISFWWYCFVKICASKVFRNTNKWANDSQWILHRKEGVSRALWGALRHPASTGGWQVWWRTFSRPWSAVLPVTREMAVPLHLREHWGGRKSVLLRVPGEVRASQTSLLLVHRLAEHAPRAPLWVHTPHHGVPSLAQGRSLTQLFLTGCIRTTGL